MTRAVLIALLLAGCASLPSARMPASEVDAAIYAWRGAGLPYTDTCREQRGEVRVLVADGAQFREACGDHAQSCEVGSLLIVRPEYDDRGHRAHEALHWLQACGMQVVDVDHANKRIWGRPDGLLSQLGG